MRQIRFAQFGGPEVLQLVDAAEPVPAAQQIRIIVRAAGVNPVDWRTRDGQLQERSPIELPAGVGQDAAGVVDRIGARARGVKVGDRVFGRGSSTYADLAVLSSWAIMPSGLSFEEAAGYPSVVETARRLLREVNATPGQTLLVSGASGGVGSALLQIARDRGIAVIGTAAQENQEYLRGLGALATTYDEGWPERVRRLGPVDAALDLAGAGVVLDLIALTGDPQRVVSIADPLAPDHGARFSAGRGEGMFQALEEAVDLIERGALRMPIERRYTLAQAREAHHDSKAGHTRGRRVILP